MAEERAQRRLAAILAADVVGYSRLIEADEEGTRVRLRSLHSELFDPRIAADGGRIVKTMGDGILVEFSSAVDAVHHALYIQETMRRRNADVTEDNRIDFRVGINVGDVIIEGDDIHGDGVNVAARLEGLCEPGEVYVSGTVYDQTVGKLAATFEDLGEQTVKNIAKPVRVYRASAGPKTGAGPELQTTDTSPPLPDKPSIAVLPFDNMSGDPEQEYFSDGITEDLITDLSKISGLFVVARNAVFFYKGRAVKPVEVSEELGVRYLLEGSVRKSGNRVRITAQLIDPPTGYHLWAERYDRDLTDIFALQDEITEKIVTALEVKLSESEQQKVARRYTENLEAYDYFLRGREQFLATNVTNAQAREMFERAIELDPGFAAAYAILSYTHFRDWYNQWSEDSQALQWAFDTAQKAVALDDSLPLAHTHLAWAYVMKQQHELAIAEANRAIALDPNFSEGYARLGEILNLSGRPEEGANLLKNAMRLDPHYPPHHLIYMGHAYYLMGKYEEAIAVLRRCLTRAPTFLGPHRTLAVIFSVLGRKEEARAEVAEMLKISPHASVDGQKERMPFKDQVVLARYVEGLREAGLPE